jgi:hypothetical protein
MSSRGRKELRKMKKETMGGFCAEERAEWKVDEFFQQAATFLVLGRFWWRESNKLRKGGGW